MQVPSDASAAPLVYAARKMGEDTLAHIIDRLPRLGCESLSEFRIALSEGTVNSEPWDWQFMTAHVLIRSRSPALRVKAEHDLDYIAALINEHDEVVFTSESRLRGALERARNEKFESLEKLFADMLAVGVLTISAMKIEAKSERFPGLRHRSTAEFLMSLAPELGTADDVMAAGRWRRESQASSEPRSASSQPSLPLKPKRVGYVYVMSDTGINGLLKIGQTTNHPRSGYTSLTRRHPTCIRWNLSISGSATILAQSNANFMRRSRTAVSHSRAGFSSRTPRQCVGR